MTRELQRHVAIPLSVITRGTHTDFAHTPTTFSETTRGNTSLHRHYPCVQAPVLTHPELYFLTRIEIKNH